MKLILSIIFLLSSCESLIYSDYKIINKNKKINLNTYVVRSGDNLYSISVNEIEVHSSFDALLSI